MVGYSEDGVLFEDGSEEKADVIVFCTGSIISLFHSMLKIIDNFVGLEMLDQGL